MKEEQERLLKYIGEIYALRRSEKKEGKNPDPSGPGRDDIVRAGRKIRKIREQKNISLEQLGMLTDLTPSYISQIEIGEADAYMTEIYDITKALGIEISALFDK